MTTKYEIFDLRITPNGMERKGVVYRSAEMQDADWQDLIHALGADLTPRRVHNLSTFAQLKLAQQSPRIDYIEYERNADGSVKQTPCWMCGDYTALSSRELDEI